MITACCFSRSACFSNAISYVRGREKKSPPPPPTTTTSTNHQPPPLWKATFDPEWLTIAQQKKVILLSSNHLTYIRKLSGFAEDPPVHMSQVLSAHSLSPTVTQFGACVSSMLYLAGSMHCHCSVAAVVQLSAADEVRKAYSKFSS